MKFGFDNHKCHFYPHHHIVSNSDFLVLPLSTIARHLLGIHHIWCLWHNVAVHAIFAVSQCTWWTFWFAHGLNGVIRTGLKSSEFMVDRDDWKLSGERSGIGVPGGNLNPSLTAILGSTPKSTGVDGVDGVDDNAVVDNFADGTVRVVGFGANCTLLLAMACVVCAMEDCCWLAWGKTCLRRYDWIRNLTNGSVVGVFLRLDCCFGVVFLGFDDGVLGLLRLDFFFVIWNKIKLFTTTRKVKRWNKKLP